MGMKNENSKNRKLERKRTVLFQIGMVVSLALVLLAFEWKTPKTSIKTLNWEVKNDDDEDIISITTPKDKQVIPVPKIVQSFKVVDNSAKMDKEIEIDFGSSEEGENDPNITVDFKQAEIVPEDTAIYKYPAKYPEFPGGENALFRYLAENIKYTREAREINLQGTVHVSFVVWKDGSIRDVKLLRDIGAGLDEKVLQVIQSMPNWIPGSQGGKAVNVEYVIPVKFKLN